ncbi:hypothetical protein ABZ639_08965 [Saccharomonospora sp. NPDC006951]
MDLLSGETDVFRAANDGRAAVVFLARRTGRGPVDREASRGVLAELDRLRGEGWSLSVDAILGEGNAQGPQAFETGFTHDRDLAGMFEAPSLDAAHEGIGALELAGWNRLLRTEWLVGPREFQPVVSPNSRGTGDEWAFFALWKWNDAWQAATPGQREEYDRECDVAFADDVRLGAAITGRHRLDVSSRWDHIGVWRVSGPAMIDEAMRGHSAVADFKFTTSRHYLGRRVAFDNALLENA